MLVDGVDVRDVALAELRRVVATAFEEPVLLSASVRENVALGVAGTDDKVWAALHVASADGFVAALPWGLDTRIGEQGLSLSGGQRQRLALSRAVLGRPPVLVLDDPLSALDVHTEAEVEAALRPGAGWGHGAGGGAPAVDRAAGRPGRDAARRRDRGGRYPPRAAGDQSGVPDAAGEYGSGGTGVTALEDGWRGVAEEERTPTR